MGRLPCVCIAILGLLSGPGLALASSEALQALDTISIPEEFQQTEFDLNRKPIINQETPSSSKPREKNNSKLCSLKRSFGPLDLGLKVNPFNINSSGLVVGLDLLRSYEILNSSSNLSEFTEAFKPSPGQYLINPEMRSILGKLLVSINDKLNSATTPALKVQ